MDEAGLKEVIDEHINRYHQFHFSGHVDDLYYDEEERAARTVLTFFHFIYDTEQKLAADEHLQKLLTAELIQNDELPKELAAYAQQRITKSAVHANRRWIPYEGHQKRDGPSGKPHFPIARPSLDVAARRVCLNLHGRSADAKWAFSCRSARYVLFY